MSVIDADDFVECDACARKSGTPTLCTSCLHNRRAIDRLRGRLATTGGAVVAIYRVEGKFGATAFLRSELANTPGVAGGATESGLWVSGYGTSPSRALAALERLVGKLALREGVMTRRSPR